MAFLGLFLIDEIRFQLEPKGKRRHWTRPYLTKKEVERLKFGN